MNTSMKRFMIGLSLLLVAVSPASSQTHNPPAPCKSCDRAYVDSTDHVSSFPPLNSGMPLDVLNGYIIFDSICRTASNNAVDSLYDIATYSDTSRKMLKYLYGMVDYNPMLFYSWEQTFAGSHHYKTGPVYLYDLFLNHVWKTYPDTGRSAVLGGSDLILHIRVIDTATRIDTNAVLARQSIVVRYQVIDTIKGKVLPLTTWAGTIGSQKNKRGISSISNVGSFEYSPDWFRLPGYGDDLPGNGHLVWFDGSPWIKTGKEYIVFLSMQQLWDGNANSYFTIWPLRGGSTMGSMYPVNAGIVDDRSNDWGTGPAPSVAAFVAGIKSRIYLLTHP